MKQTYSHRKIASLLEKIGLATMVICNFHSNLFNTQFLFKCTLSLLVFIYSNLR